MRFRVLGPLEAYDGDTQVALGGPKRKAVLAVLLLNPNRVVSADGLVEQVWGDEAAFGAAKTLQVYISQLRKTLRRATADDLILTQPPGYRVAVARDELDLLEFEDLLAQARSVDRTRNPARVAQLLHAALGLWHGALLADLALEPFVQTYSAALEESRLGTLEDRVDADLACGRHAVLCPELETLVAAHPYRERLRGQLMLALYRSGRQADALRAYRNTQEVLVEELGIDPGPELRDLEDRILRHDESLLAPIVAYAPGVETTVDQLASEPAANVPPPAAVDHTREMLRVATVLRVRVRIEPERAPNDPEALARALAPLREQVRELVRAYGGMPTGVDPLDDMIVFGVPTAMHDHRARAAALVSELESTFSAGVAFGIGSGEVLARVAADGTISVAGMPVVVASAMEGVELHARRAAPIDATHVGREKELALLAAMLDRTIADRLAHRVTLVGPPGIGKTALVQEFLSRVATNVVVLSGRCVPYGTRHQSALASLMRDAMRAPPFDATLTHLVDVPDLAARTAGLLSEVVGHSARTSSGDDVVWAVRTVVHAIARGKPVVVFVEDVHCADATMLATIEEVARTGHDLPILLLVEARAELIDEYPEWGNGWLNATTLALAPLDETHMFQLATRIGDIDVPARLEALVTRAGGNPFFLTELLAHEHDGGSADTVPSSLRTALDARVDRLAPRDRCRSRSGGRRRSPRRRGNSGCRPACT